MSDEAETSFPDWWITGAFSEFLRKTMLSPKSWFASEPVLQSAGAHAIGAYLLVLLVVGQFWMLAHDFLAYFLLYVTWRVARSKMGRGGAIATGTLLLLLSLISLPLLLLGQFCVLVTIPLSVWQYVSLIRTRPSLSA